tara:strand:+ start:47951 stop:48160 length:210 start_codon:yes stop_codon:yes gene_type:complete
MIGTINKKNEHPLNKGSTTRISVSQASSFKKQDRLPPFKGFYCRQAGFEVIGNGCKLHKFIILLVAYSF